MTKFNPAHIHARMLKDQKDAERFHKRAADPTNSETLRLALHNRAAEFEYYAERAEKWLDNWRRANKPCNQAA